MKVFAYIAITILALAGIAALSVGGSGLNYWLNKTFSPLNEQVRHDTFECSASHTDGIVRELRQIRDQYNHADDAGKAALADTFRHEADGFTCYALPSDLQSFEASIR
jgi:hypothetical protein